jgi:hypothetical protein
MGPVFSEGTLLRIAYAFEQNTSHHRARPSLKSSGSAVPVKGAARQEGGMRL